MSDNSGELLKRRKMERNRMRQKSSMSSTVSIENSLTSRSLATSMDSTTFMERRTPRNAVSCMNQDPRTIRGSAVSSYVLFESNEVTGQSGHFRIYKAALSDRPETPKSRIKTIEEVEFEAKLKSINALSMQVDSRHDNLVGVNYKLSDFDEEAAFVEAELKRKKLELQRKREIEEADRLQKVPNNYMKPLKFYQ